MSCPTKKLRQNSSQFARYLPGKRGRFAAGGEPVTKNRLESVFWDRGPATGSLRCGIGARTQKAGHTGEAVCRAPREAAWMEGNQRDTPVALWRRDRASSLRAGRKSSVE